MGVTCKKILRDILTNKIKSLFILTTLFITNVVFSIVIMISNVLTPEVEKAYFRSMPAEVVIKCEAFNNDVLGQFETIPEIDKIQGSSERKVRVIINEKKLNANLIVIDQNDNRINKLLNKNGIDEPPTIKESELFLERAIQNVINLKPGETIELLSDNDKSTKLRLNDYIYDSTSEPYLLEGDIYAYTNQDTFKLLTGDGRFDKILLTVKGDKSKIYNEKIADQVVGKLNDLGIRVDDVEVKNPSIFFASQALDGINILLTFMGLLIIIMACTLIINTFNNMMLQQTKTIGILKSIGGSNLQIIRMYLLQILIIGFLIYAISLPISFLIAKIICCKIGFLFNVSLSYLKMPILLPLILFISAIIIPALSAGIPVIKTVKATVYDSLYLNIRNNQFQYKNTLFTKAKAITIMGRYVIRNNIRDRIRTVLTMITLMLSACILMTSLNLYKSFNMTIKESRSLFPDGMVTLKGYYNDEDLMKIAGEIKQIKVAEPWNLQKALFVEPSGKSKNVILSAAKSTSTIINYPLLKEKLIEGKLLSNQNTNEILINNHLLNLYPDIKVGNTINLNIAGRIYDFKVVGILSIFGQPSSPTLYVNYEYFNQLLKGPDMVNDIRFNTISLSEKELEEVITNLETKLNKEGIYISETNTGDKMFEEFSMSANIIVALLLLIAILMLIVGTIGLSGSLNINLMERINEFGIIRAIGGSEQQIKRYIFLEGLVFTGVSWIAGNLLSIPFVDLLAKILGKTLFGIEAKLEIGILGIIIGLFIALAITMIACIIPFHNFKKSVIKDMLAYE